MAEIVVQEKLQDLYILIARDKVKVNWETIKEDFEKLFWINPKEFSEPILTHSIWEIVNECANSQLTLNSRYNIMKLVKVKMTLCNYYAKILDKKLIKEICNHCSTEAKNMSFLEKCTSTLNACGADSFSGTANKIFDAFQEIKKTFNSIYMHFEKHIKSELSTNLSDLLNEVFNESFITNFYTRLSSQSETKHIVDVFSSYNKTKKTNDDSISYSASAFTTKGLNHYIGEISEDGDREGYGKIQYYSGDTYEGYWKKNKRHGHGLYIYKYGGMYLGNFYEDHNSGEGCRVYNSGNCYTGRFENSKKQGQGLMKFKNGDVYEGEWDNDDMHGNGKYTWSTGDYFIGQFVRDKQEGKGSLFLIDGQIIEGMWKAGFMIQS
ncbi:hypothetical protein SteCoe_7910 [Stentor coeruleus]|uniref:MORN repeat protein n=1 Tax=Stentor coeruleus TaxID=5963 RepID=A0A1R2CLD4_9CILI|nr:hypothetical protein SteCoe_7910 [Stentor coeruleus]